MLHTSVTLLRWKLPYQIKHVQKYRLKIQYLQVLLAVQCRLSQYEILASTLPAGALAVGVVVIVEGVAISSYPEECHAHRSQKADLKTVTKFLE